MRYRKGERREREKERMWEHSKKKGMNLEKRLRPGGAKIDG